MGSSEIVESGRSSGGRSNFSHTCTLLSRYLKDKGSFGELSRGLTHHNSESKGAPTETMNLLSMIEKSDQNSCPRDLNAPPPAAKPEVETAPMTLFYAGQVIVFNDFPADKAKEIMMLASKSSTAQNKPNAAFALPRTAQSPAESATVIPGIVPAAFGIQDHPHHSPQPSLDSDLPIARKNSLARFLEKRRDRVTANAPYPASKHVAAPPSSVKTEAWLGLAASQLPLQIQRNQS